MGQTNYTALGLQQDGEEAQSLFQKVYNGSATIDPASIATGAQATATITVTGAVVGMAAMAFPPYSLQGLQHSAYVSAADTVTVVLKNDTGGAVDLASGVWKAKVFAA